MIHVAEAIEVTCIQATESASYRNRKVYQVEGKDGFWRLDAGEHKGLQPGGENVAMVDGTMRRMVPFEALNAYSSDRSEDQTRET